MAHLVHIAENFVLQKALSATCCAKPQILIGPYNFKLGLARGQAKRLGFKLKRHVGTLSAPYEFQFLKIKGRGTLGVTLHLPNLKQLCTFCYVCTACLHLLCFISITIQVSQFFSISIFHFSNLRINDFLFSQLYGFRLRLLVLGLVNVWGCGWG